MNFMACAQKSWDFCIARLSDFGAEKEDHNKLYAPHFSFQTEWNFEINQNMSPKVHLIRVRPFLFLNFLWASIFSLMSHIPAQCVYNPQIEPFGPSLIIPDPFDISFYFQRSWYILWDPFFRKPTFSKKDLFSKKD